MEPAEVLLELRRSGDPKNVAIWNAYGVRPSCDFYGVSLSDLKLLAKKINRNHDLSLLLWDTEMHDAHLLSTYIEEPKKVSSLQLSQQVATIDTCDLGQKFTENIVLATPFAQSLASQWTQRQEEYCKQCGFLALAGFAKKDKSASNAFFSFYLTQIEREIKQERNWVKEAMNLALITIGKRNEELRKAVIQVLENTGAIEINYGTSSCKAPNAALVLNH